MNEKSGTSRKSFRQDAQHHYLLTEYSNELMLMVDSCGQISYLSPSAIRTMGYAAAEVIDRALIELVHPDDQVDTAKALARVKQNPDAQFTLELRFLFKDGSWHDLEMVCRNLLENVSVKGIAINCYDISTLMATKQRRLKERKQLQNLLDLYRRADARIRDIEAFVIEECVRISASPLCFFGFVNSEETKMSTHLWSKQAMQGCAIDFKPVVFSLSDAGIWAEAIRTRQPLIVNDYRQPDPRKKGYPKGHVQIKRLLSIPIIKEAKVVAVMAVANKELAYTQTDILHLSLFIESMWDVLKRKEAEEELRNSEIQLRDIIACTSDWIWEIDAQGTYTFCSGRIHQVLGYKPAEVLGRTFFDLMLPEEAERLGNWFSDLAARKAPIVNVEKWNLAKDGRWVCLLTNGVPTVDREGRFIGYRGADQDITERKTAEEEKNKLIAELKDAITNIKKLTGLLPICSFCKKIRDSEGDWKQLEAYITNHSEANFSHSICPECIKKFYPDLDVQE